MLNNIGNMIWIELHKASRSRMPLFTALGFLLLPFVDAFFMVILKDPDFARRAGLISDKAQLMAGVADWPTYLDTLAQAISLGGIFLFSLIGSWVFGREFVDGTAKDLLAVPVSRWAILLAKFIVVMLWSAALTVLIYGVTLLLGVLIGLPQGSVALLLEKSGTVAVTTLLVIVVLTPVAFFASIGRGYLLPVGVTILFVLFANILVVAGWGPYFPWAIPALYAGTGDTATQSLGLASYLVVAATSLAGIVATYIWWHYADQSH